MATGDVTITRGVGARDDYPDANLTQSNSPSVSGISLTTDGDILTFSGTFTNPGVSDAAIAYRAVSPTISSTTYNSQIYRAKIVTSPGANFFIANYIHFTDGTTNSLFFTTIGTFVVLSNQLTTGKQIDRIGLQVQSSQTQTGTFTFSVQWDFIYVFKETLTLPAVSSPLTLSLSRYVVELPIPTREGGVLQDLGSASGQLEVDGTLITTTSPNNYTGDQWWDVLVGTWLEANWQWLTSDRVSYKYQIESLTPTEEPGKVGYYGFKMKLRKVDILTASAQTFGSATGTGGIQ